MSEASDVIALNIAATVKNVEREVSNRAYRASNELRSSALHILRGQRTGRVYKVPFTKRVYTASAPGEPPAVRTGRFRTSWSTLVRVEKTHGKFRAISFIESNLRAGKYMLGDILEKGTERMSPRPYKQPVIDRALPTIMELYKKTYAGG
jgi:hypothetical protein